MEKYLEDIPSRRTDKDLNERGVSDRIVWENSSKSGNNHQHVLENSHDFSNNSARPTAGFSNQRDFPWVPGERKSMPLPSSSKPLDNRGIFAVIEL